MEINKEHNEVLSNLIKYAYLNLTIDLIKSTMNGQEESQPYSLAATEAVKRMLRSTLVSSILTSGPRENAYTLMHRSGLDLSLTDSAYMLMLEELSDRL